MEAKTVEHSQKSTRAGTKELRHLLFDVQQCRCALTGIVLTPETAALDHKVPVSIGGGHSVRNLQWLAVEINQMKGGLSNERFVELCRMVASGPSGS